MPALSVGSQIGSQESAVQRSQSLHRSGSDEHVSRKTSASRSGPGTSTGAVPRTYPTSHRRSTPRYGAESAITAVYRSEGTGLEKDQVNWHLVGGLHYVRPVLTAAAVRLPRRLTCLLG